MNRPFDITPPADYPRDNIIPWPSARPRGRNDAPRSVRASLDPADIARATGDAGMLAALDRRAAEAAFEAAYDDFMRADGRTRLGARVVSPPPPELVAQVRREDAAFNRVPFGERLVLWMRAHGETASYYFALGSIALLVASIAAAYVGGVR